MLIFHCPGIIKQKGFGNSPKIPCFVFFLFTFMDFTVDTLLKTNQNINFYWGGWTTSVICFSVIVVWKTVGTSSSAGRAVKPKLRIQLEDQNLCPPSRVAEMSCGPLCLLALCLKPAIYSIGPSWVFIEKNIILLIHIYVINTAQWAIWEYLNTKTHMEVKSSLICAHFNIYSWIGDDIFSDFYK